jgi:vacuolar-type H+-ATPase subunit E/Vma4
MENIGEAVINKVNKEAQNIIDKAKDEAKLEIEKANEERQLKLEKTKQKKLQDADEESARIASRASIEIRQHLVAVKAEVVNKIINEVKNKLAKTSMDRKAFIALVTEAVNAIEAEKVRIYVPKGNTEKIKGYIQAEKDLKRQIIEFKEGNFVGGFILEDTNGGLRIDNTYAARMEMLLPRIMPEINKELFQS